MSAEVKKLFKDGKIMTAGANQKLEEILTRGDSDEAAAIINALYINTNDAVTKILIREVARLKGILLFEEDDKRVA